MIIPVHLTSSRLPIFNPTSPCLVKANQSYSSPPIGDAGKLGSLKGVRAVITAADIPGENQIGAIIADEELLATTEVHFIGHPIAIVIADTPEIARHATKLMHAMIEVKQPIVCPREAFKRGHFIEAPRSFVMGDVEKGWPDCAVVVEGECDIAGQEHLYLETQRARAAITDGESAGPVHAWPLVGG